MRDECSNGYVSRLFGQGFDSPLVHSKQVGVVSACLLFYMEVFYEEGDFL